MNLNDSVEPLSWETDYLIVAEGDDVSVGERGGIVFNGCVYTVTVVSVDGDMVLLETDSDEPRDKDFLTVLWNRFVAFFR